MEKAENKDYIIRATAAQGQIRAFAATTREIVEYARSAHDTSPVVTAALGRMLTAGAMMGVMQKNEDDLLTMYLRGDGPMKGVTVTADAEGTVKGYPHIPQVIIPANDKGKLDVSGAIGNGSLSIVKDMGLKDPYVGQVELQTGEIAEDLAYYYAVSEQVPSAVGLGVLMNKDNTVRQAGGFIIQLMPYTDDKTIDLLEEKLSDTLPVTTLLDQGMNPEGILEYLLGDLELEILDKLPTQFRCDCSVEKVERTLYSIDKSELQSMIDDGEPIEVKCHFCNKAYVFTPEELKKIASNHRR